MELQYDYDYSTPFNTPEYEKSLINFKYTPAQKTASYDYSPATLTNYITTMPTFTIPKISIPKVDVEKLQNDVKQMLNEIQTKTLAQGINIQNDLLDTVLKSTEAEATKLNTLINKTVNKLVIPTTDKEIRVTFNALSNLQSSLDMMAAASSELKIDDKIRNMADSGRTTITAYANSIDNVLKKIEETTKKVAQIVISNPGQKVDLQNVISQLDANKLIIENDGKTAIEKIADLTKNNIKTLQLINNDKITMIDNAKTIPAQIINDITKTASMAYKITDITADTKMAEYMKPYISKTEEKNGILASDKTVNGKTAFQAMIEYKKINPIANTILPKLMDVPIGSVEPETKQGIITGKQNYAEYNYDAPIQMKGSGTKITEQKLTEISMSDWVKQNPNVDPSIGAKLFTEQNADSRTYKIQLDNMKNLLSSAQSDLKLKPGERKSGKGISSETWDTLNRKAVILETGEIKEYIESGTKQTDYTFTQQEPSKISQIIPPTMSITNLNAFMQPGESASQYILRLKDAGMTNSQPNVVRIESEKIKTDDPIEIQQRLQGKGTTNALETNQGILESIGTRIWEAYLSGGEAGASEHAVTTGLLEKRTIELGDRPKNELNEIRSWNDVYGQVLNSADSLITNIKGLNPEKVYVTEYAAGKKAGYNGQDLINAAVTGKSLEGNSVEATRAAAYKIMKTEDFDKMASTDYGKRTLAIDTTYNSLKGDITGKLSQKTQNTISEQYQDPEIARRVGYGPGQSINQAVGMIVNPYTGSQNVFVDMGIFILTGGIADELKIVPTGIASIAKSSVKTGGKILAGESLDLSSALQKSGTLISALIVPGIGDTSKLGTALKNEQGVFEVIDAGKKSTVVPWKGSTIELESDIFNAATSNTKTKELINKIIKQSSDDLSGTSTKLGISILTQPKQIEAIEANLEKITGLSTDNIATFKSILTDAKNKVDIQAMNLGRELNSMDTTKIGDNIQKLRTEIGEIPTQNLLNRALVINDGENAEAVFKGWEALNSKIDDAFDPIRTAIEVPAYTIGTPMSLLETLGKTIGMPNDAIKAIQSIGTKYGDTIEDALKNIDLESMKVQTDLRITTDQVNTITDMMKTLMLKKGEALKEIKPIAKTLDISYLPTAIDIKGLGDIPGRLQANGINTMADFATKSNEDLIKIASKEGISEPLLISTKQQINKMINWEATPGLESELTEKITGIPHMEVLADDIGIEQFKRWDLDWEQAEGVKLNTETGKWSIKDTKGMTDTKFNQFIDEVSQTSLRDMNITDLPTLSLDATEDATRRKMLSIAQEQAKEGSVPFEFMTTIPGEMSLAEPYKYVIDNGGTLRTKAIAALKEIGKIEETGNITTIGKTTQLTPTKTTIETALDQKVTEINAARSLAKLEPMKQADIDIVQSNLIEEQEKFVDDVQVRGTLADIRQNVPQMSVIDVDEFADNMATKYPSTQSLLPHGTDIKIWNPPTRLPTTTNEALDLATKTYDEIKMRSVGDTATNLNVEKALTGDIPSLNRVYEKDPTLGAMIDTRNAALAQANAKHGNAEMRSAMNAVKYGRDDQAALLFNRMDPKSSMEGYVKSGYFDDVTMKDLQRLEQSGVSPEMTTKLMVERSDAATKALGRESKSIEFKLSNGDTDFTKEELKIMTSDKNLANAIDATWNPIGKQTNIIADAMMKNADDLKEIERLEGLKNKARELVC